MEQKSHLQKFYKNQKLRGINHRILKTILSYKLHTHSLSRRSSILSNLFFP